MASIKGLGGAFMESNDAKKLAEWYETALGIKMMPENSESGGYHVFHTIDAETGDARENPVFAINQSKETLPASNRGFMFNFRVDDLDEFLEELESQGIKQEREKIKWKRGKHAWVKDIDGNMIELYEELFPEEIDIDEEE